MRSQAERGSRPTSSRVLAAITICIFAATLTAAEATRPVPSGMLLNRADHLDDEVAALMEQRPTAGQSAGPTTELQVDLHITASWLLHESAQSPSEDVQSCGYLRVCNLLSAADALAQRLQQSPPGAAQIDAIRKLHEMTYRFNGAASVARMDETCKALANLLVTIGGPLQPPGRGLPLMRPMKLDRPDDQQQAWPPSLAELTTFARQVSVSPALHRQLVALAQTTAAASSDPARQDEAAALYGILARSVEMSRGLQQGGIVDPQTRGRIEPQLADGIVLFLDPRTRAAGKSRIDRLSAFDDMLRRVRALRIPAELHDRLAPALAWAQRHNEQGPAIVQTVDDYLSLYRRFDAIKLEPSLQDAQKKVVSELDRQFTAQRQGFLSDVAGLGESGGMIAITPEQLRSRVSVMAQTFEEIELVNGIPSSLQAISAYKPRPTGGLERRALVAASALTGIVQSPAPADAINFLRQLRTMGQVARQLAATGDLPPEINRTYAGGKFSEFNGRRVEMLTDVASQAAAGKTPDATRLARLAASQELLDAARDGTKIEAVLKHADVLNRWADWNVQPQVLRSVLNPYRTATAAAVSSFADGDAGAIDLWRPVRQGSEPLLALVREMGTYEEQCREFPAGWPGELARLLTPMDRAPFAAQRHATLLLATWEAATTKGDGVESARISDLLDAQLRKELGSCPFADRGKGLSIFHNRS